MDTLKTASLIVNILILLVVLFGVLWTIYIKGRPVTSITYLNLILKFGSLDAKLFRPVSDEWLATYNFDQQGRLWFKSPTSLDIKRGVSLFWLGHDLLWTAIALKTNQEPRQIRRGLTMAAWQMEQSGLSGFAPYPTLKKLIENFNSDPRHWDDERRASLAADLILEAHAIGEKILNGHVKTNGPKDWYFPLPPRPDRPENVAEIEPFATDVNALRPLQKS